VQNASALMQTRVFQIAGVCYDLANRNPLPAMLRSFQMTLLITLPRSAISWLVIVPPGFVLGWSQTAWVPIEVPLFPPLCSAAIGLSVFPVLMHLCWAWVPSELSGASMELSGCFYCAARSSEGRASRSLPTHRGVLVRAGLDSPCAGCYI